MSRHRREIPKPLTWKDIRWLNVELAAGPGFWRIRLRTRWDTVFMHIVTVQDEHLHLSFTGDWGSWAYEWYHTGQKGVEGALHFAGRMGPDYLMRKLGQGRLQEVFYSAETAANIKAALIERRREGEITREVAREAWDARSWINDEDPCEVREYLSDNSEAFGGDSIDLADLWVYGPPSELVFLCYGVYPILAEYVRRGFKAQPPAVPGQLWLLGV